MSPHGLSILPSIVATGIRADDPYNDGLHELAASRRHSPPIARRLVVSYTTFSPLLQTIWSGRSLLPDPAVANSFYFRKWSVLCCPDFPLVHQYLCTSDKPQQCFRVQRYCKRVEKQNKLGFIFVPQVLSFIVFLVYMRVYRRVAII